MATTISGITYKKGVFTIAKTFKPDKVDPAVTAVKAIKDGTGEDAKITSYELTIGSDLLTRYGLTKTTGTGDSAKTEADPSLVTGIVANAYNGAFPLTIVINESGAALGNEISYTPSSKVSVTRSDDQHLKITAVSGGGALSAIADGDTLVGGAGADIFTVDPAGDQAKFDNVVVESYATGKKVDTIKILGDLTNSYDLKTGDAADGASNTTTGGSFLSEDDIKNIGVHTSAKANGDVVVTVSALKQTQEAKEAVTADTEKGIDAADAVPAKYSFGTTTFTIKDGAHKPLNFVGEDDKPIAGDVTDAVFFTPEGLEYTYGTKPKDTASATEGEETSSSGGSGGATDDTAEVDKSVRIATIGGDDKEYKLNEFDAADYVETNQIISKKAGLTIKATAKKATTIEVAAGGNNIYGRAGDDTIKLAAADETSGAKSDGDTINWGTGDGVDTVENFDLEKDVVRFTKGGFTPVIFEDSILFGKTGKKDGKTVPTQGVLLQDAAKEKDEVTVRYVDAKGNENRVILLKEGSTFTYADDVTLYNGAKINASKNPQNTLNVTGAATIDLTDTKRFVNINNIVAAAAADGEETETGGLNVIIGKTASTVTGGDGNDSVTTGTKASYIVGGKGSDYITITGTAADTVYTGVAVADAAGSSGSGSEDAVDENTVIGGPKATGTKYVIYGDDGNDTITFEKGGGTIDAGEGNNTITVGKASKIAVGEGTDIITVGAGKNTITAKGGGNTITTNAGTVTMTLGTKAGESTAAVSTGTNVLTLGKGAVTADIVGGSTIVTNEGAGTKHVITITGETGVNNIDLGLGGGTVDLSGSKFKDDTAEDSYNTLTGGAKKSTIIGSENADEIIAGTGGGTFTLAGNDTVKAGTGADIIVVSGTDNVIEGFDVAKDKIQYKDVAGENVKLELQDNGDMLLVNGEDTIATIVGINGHEMITITDGEKRGKTLKLTSALSYTDLVGVDEAVPEPPAGGNGDQTGDQTGGNNTAGGDSGNDTQSTETQTDSPKLVNATDKTITAKLYTLNKQKEYEDVDSEEGIAAATKIELLAEYEGTTFNANLYGKVGKATNGNSTLTDKITVIDATGAKSAMTVIGNANANEMTAKAGSTYVGGAKNDKITLTGGNNTVQLGAADGTDQVYEFDAKNDKIEFTAGEVTKYSAKLATTSVKNEDKSTTYTTGLNLTVGSGKSAVVLNALGTTDSGTDKSATIKTVTDSLTGSNNKVSVTVNDKTHYFSVEDVTVAKAKDRTGVSFTYEADAYYHGGSSKADTVKVDSGATIDLAGEDAAKYQGVEIIDGSDSSAALNVKVGATAVTVKGAKNKDNTFTGGKAASYLVGGSGAKNTFISDDKGKETFVITGGTENTIENYTSNKDIVLFQDADKAALEDANLSYNNGGDLTIKVGESSVTVKNVLAKGSKVIIQGKDAKKDKLTVTANGLKTKAKSNTSADGVTIKGKIATLSKDFAGSETFEMDSYPAITTVKTAKELTNSVKITGTAGKDTITLAHNGAATIAGGKGDDKITLTNISKEATKNVRVVKFTTGDGKDVVTGFESGSDILSLKNGDSPTVGAAGKNVTVALSETDVITLNGMADAKGAKKLIIDAKGDDAPNDKTTYVVGAATSANKFTYEDKVTFVGSATKTDTLTIQKAVSDVTDLTLKADTFANIDVFQVDNTTGADGKAVAADNAVKTALKLTVDSLGTNATLKGGLENDTYDLTSAGDYATTVWFAAGYGKDTITGVDKDERANDVVLLDGSYTYTNSKGKTVKGTIKSIDQFDFTLVNDNKDLQISVNDAAAITNLGADAVGSLTITGWSANGLNTFQLGKKQYKLISDGETVGVHQKT